MSSPRDWSQPLTGRVIGQEKTDDDRNVLIVEDDDGVTHRIAVESPAAVLKEADRLFVNAVFDGVVQDFSTEEGWER